MCDGLDTAEIADFQEVVWRYYDAHGRHDLPWRQVDADGCLDPYHVLVSELMLQQTQVSRVIPKYHAFLARFPTVSSLAAAELGDVLRLWQGLGYNRRAKFLWQAAQQIMHDFQGDIPQDITQLVTLSGVGVNTAGAIVAYAYNQPAVFVETNIRTVYIYHFGQHNDTYHDADITACVARTLPDDPQMVRPWYWALMDYGTYIKQTHGNLNKLSKSYTKQSRFEGSKRQVRGSIIRLLSKSPLTKHEILQQHTDQRAEAVLQELVAEGLVRDNQGVYSL